MREGAGLHGKRSQLPREKRAKESSCRGDVRNENAE